jgi:hypothetical protein
MECVGKTCCAANRVRRLPILLPESRQDLEFPRTKRSGFRLRTLASLTPANRLNSGAGEGIRTPDPLITNQMLYRLSYASNSGDSRASAQTNPSDPFHLSGTII